MNTFMAGSEKGREEKSGKFPIFILIAFDVRYEHRQCRRKLYRKIKFTDCYCCCYCFKSSFHIAKHNYTIVNPEQSSLPFECYCTRRKRKKKSIQSKTRLNVKLFVPSSIRQCLQPHEHTRTSECDEGDRRTHNRCRQKG